MSKRESDDLERSGHFLPEDGQQRLKKLCDHMQFLVQLAQPRTRDEEQDRAPELYVGDVALCLEQLAEQAELVLDALSWSSKRRGVASEAEHGAVAAVASEASGAAGERYPFGVTLDQIDTLERLVGTIAAHGDIVATGPTAELADGTLPHLGQAVYDAAVAVRVILDEVQAQRLEQIACEGTGVSEARAVYAVGLVSPLGALRGQVHFSKLAWRRKPCVRRNGLGVRGSSTNI